MNLPSKVALNLLIKMKKIKFITSDIVAVVEESDMDQRCFRFFSLFGLELLAFPNLLELSLLLWSLLGWLVI